MVWDQGINYILAKHLEALGVKCVMNHNAEFDPFGYAPESKHYTGRLSTKRFVVDALKSALRCDVVHVHSYDKITPWIKMIHKPLIIHYHGSDIRGRWEERRRYWSRADKILVSTPDLLNGAPTGVKWLPNPVDTDTFKPRGEKRVAAALHFNYGAVDLAEKIARAHNIKLVILEKGVPYRDMPGLLNQYTHYVDVKRDYMGRVLITKPSDPGSMIGLQALACGLTVLRLDGELRGLPPMHRPENVASKLKMIYDEVLGK